MSYRSMKKDVIDTYLEHYQKLSEQEKKAIQENIDQDQWLKLRLFNNELLKRIEELERIVRLNYIQGKINQ